MKKLPNYKHCSFTIPILLLLFVSSTLYANHTEAAEIKKVIKVPEIYLVKKGDHLWKLSKKEYQDPYRWRFLWENNNFIDNPNLIYPGDRIFIPGRFVDKEVVEVVENKPVPKKIASPKTEPKSQLIPIVPDYLYSKSGYIIRKENPRGRLIYGAEGKSIFGRGDTLYTNISGKDIKKGDTFIVYREMHKVKHPVKWKTMGMLIQEVGLVEITNIGEDNSTVRIVDSYSNIELGNSLIKKEDINENLYDPSAEKEEKEIEGYIVEGKEERSTYGLKDIVYLDVGKKNGVKPGDIFIAYDYGKRVKKGGVLSRKTTLPIEVLSKLKVFKVKEATSTAILIYSRKETSIGAPIKYIKE